jgi:hypothetical protein
VEHGDARITEGDGNGFESAFEIRREDRGDAVVATAFTEETRLFSPSGIQSARVPTRADAALVVLCDRVRLEHHGDRHHRDAQ